MSNATLVRKVIVQNREGLHARPAHLLVKAASNFEAEITIGKNAEMVDCKSILSLLMLGAAQGTELTVNVDGPDAADAMDAIGLLFETGFDEPAEADESSADGAVVPTAELED